MSSRLDRVKDWNAFAIECKYQLDVMATKSGVSERTLRRYIHQKLGSSPKVWVDQARVKGITEEISQGNLVKTAAADFYFKQRSHLSKFFKRVTGKAPTKYRQRC